ncbi:uncharacterized protein BYT42DRAFT_548301 [Radiomyces spectabilis]|uniref:uncharacterized protein n=1 Tax=Radiomyces spectabilis TaxID=64574 RepID=UPI00221E914F|nr:uncharacterized protein BYT42DRAFT_548301 [Radiomyces spectabilis]KAI8371431.1 hypothetical protein BYT42DRAFT_548301 [Radiomyces spectabilis]
MTGHSAVKYEAQIADIQHDIENAKKAMANLTKEQVGKKQVQLSKSYEQSLQKLKEDYDRLRQVRLQQGQNYTQFDQSRSTARKERQKDIRERQKEFDAQLDQQYHKDRLKWKEPTIDKSTAYERLLRALRHINLQDIQNDLSDTENLADQEAVRIIGSAEEEDGLDTSVIIIPTGILELFWTVDIPAPAHVSELASTIELIEKRYTSEKFHK